MDTPKTNVTHHKPKLLWVEDSKDFGESNLRPQLEAHYDITHCADVATALTALETPHAALLTDKSLGTDAMGGYKVAALARKKYPQMPIIMLSSSPESQYAIHLETVAAGSRYLDKSGNDVADTVINIIDQGLSTGLPGPSN